MHIPKTSQVPVWQSMYVNGVMHQTWINFFERLAALADVSNLVDLIELAQKAAELPSQAIQAQQGFDIANIQNQFFQENLATIQDVNQFESIPIQISVNDHLPPVQAVFLCPEQYIHLAPVPFGDIIHD